MNSRLSACTKENPTGTGPTGHSWLASSYDVLLWSLAEVNHDGGT